MSLLDIRTIILSYIISNAVCLLVMALLWHRNRQRFNGLGFWLADFAFQFAVVPLVALRGIVPDFASMVVSNSLAIAGTILLYIGLERFVNKRTSQLHNYVLLGVFIAIHTYFAVVQPNLLIRTINLSAGIILLCSQCAWLLMYRVDARMRPVTRGVGHIFLAFCVFSLARILVDLKVDPGNDFFRSGIFEALAVLVNQMLFIILTFGLLLMVNRRLVLELEHDIAGRKKAEEESRNLGRFPDENPNPVLRATYQGRIIYANAASSHVLEYFGCRVGGPLPASWQHLIAELAKTGSCETLDVECGNKTYLMMFVSVASANYVNLYGQDITERKKAEEELQGIARQRQLALDAAHMGWWHYDPITQISSWDERYGEIFGVTGYQRLNNEILARLHPDDVPEVWAKVEAALDPANPQAYLAQYRIILPDGAMRWIEAQGIALFEGDREGRKATSFIGTVADITERKQAEDKLNQLSRAVEQSPVSIVITDLEGRIQYVNPKFTQVTGYSLEEVIGQNPRILKSGKTPPEEYQSLWNTLRAGGEWHGEFVNRKKSGELYFESALISPIANPDGYISHFLAVKEDITRRKQAEEELLQTNQMLERQMDEIRALQESLYEQTMHDYLTGLYNRRFLSESLERELARARREGYPISFVMIDVDQFKSINDNFGHELGDKLLQYLGRQLGENMRASDIACRYGGDECLVVLPNTSLASAVQIAERWRAGFEATNIVPAIKTTLSLGVATYPLHASTSKEILAAADGALYLAKSAGRNRVAIWRE